MSHRCGTVQPVNPVVTIGPASGSPATSPNTWLVTFNPPAAPTGTRFLILHFRNVSLPASNRLEVDLGYGTDTFTSASGTDFWTRPINVYALAGGVPVRYITNGSGSGGAELDRYGRGEALPATESGHNSITNCDPFLKDPAYTEPTYDTFWYCANPPNWENVERVASAADVRRKVARSVGMIVTVHGTAPNEEVSTCSVTLVDSDVVITAGHCHTPAETLSSSVTFDYELRDDGTRPPGYNARFTKVKEGLAYHYSGGYDYSFVRLAEAPAGVPVVQMRHDLPAAGEQVFGVHHPNGAPKKLSIPHPGFTAVSSSDAMHVRVPSTFHVSGGSSGSGLFDLAGRIVGVLSNGDPCNGVSLTYFPTATAAIDSQPAPPPPVTRDVMVVFDRSGSMSMSDGAGRTKIEAARDAVSLFVQLVRAGTGNRAGLVSFSTAASAPVDFPIAAVTAGNKNALIGSAPFSGGIVGGLVPGGATSIGSGLDKARLQFPMAGTNPRALLLLTDGLQNTPPWISDVSLDGIDVHAIGFGTASSLDGALLTDLATTHNGLYTRAGNGLALEKFFSHAFGNIFAAGVLFDPEYDLPAAQRVSRPESFRVCGEETITVVVGWDRPDASLRISLTTPLGAPVSGATAGTTEAIGRTWTFLRVPLPQGTERDGVWNAFVSRPGGEGEFPPPAPDLRYFISIIPEGGPRLLRMPDRRRYYTGDAINPIVELRYADGSWPENATATVTVSRPDAGMGNLLSRAKLGQPVFTDGDTIPARQATLAALESQSGKPAVGYGDGATIPLSQEAADTEGRMEPAAVFGRRLDDLFTIEGDYTFHFRASYGDGCTATRELVWSAHVDVGIDPSRTDVTVTGGTIVVTPRDRFGNLIGPGRSDGFTVTSVPGTTVTGPVVDNGDGSYTFPVATESGSDPGLVIGQPGRPPVVVAPPKAPVAATGCAHWVAVFWLLIAIIIILLVLLVWKP